MEIILIEKQTFDAMVSRFEAYTRKADAVLEKFSGRDIKWLDNQDVCLMLNISPRTLQTMRDNRSLPFTRINRKIFYRPADVEKLVKKSPAPDNEPIKNKN